MKTILLPFISVMFMLALSSCGTPQKERIPAFSPFDEDVTFLRKFSEVIELKDASGQSRVAVMPALQARVMTSTAGGPDNLSYGWINRRFFESGDTSVHMNAFGGEERFWMGPEGGQYSIFFQKDSAFTFDNWRTPRLIDLDAWEVSSRTRESARFTKPATITNYSGTTFHISIEREIKVLEQSEIFQRLELPSDSMLSSVAFQTTNSIENTGTEAWNRKTGLLSIWLLGMFNPSPEVTMIIPFNEGPESALGEIVHDDYFGKVPTDRLKTDGNVIYFKGDGQYRSKIGLSPARAKDLMASYDAGTKTLTIVKYSKGEPGNMYVNSKWEIQRYPYSGDVVNAYNDGPPSPGEKPMGPFFELESSSPARELKPGEKIVHTQTTFHFQGPEEKLNLLTTRLLGVSLEQIVSAF